MTIAFEVVGHIREKLKLIFENFDFFDGDDISDFSTRRIGNCMEILMSSLEE